MKNIIIAAAVGISAVSFNAQAADSTQACGMFENETRFNPTSLSDYQECWLDFHYPDKMSGTLGSLFWVKVVDEFVSMPVKTLVREGSAEKAKQLVVTKIIEIINNERIDELTQMLAEASEEIVELETQITTLKGVRDDLMETLGEKNTAIQGLNSRIETLQGEVRDLRLQLANISPNTPNTCLLYTSDAADE